MTSILLTVPDRANIARGKKDIPPRRARRRGPAHRSSNCWRAKPHWGSNADRYGVNSGVARSGKVLRRILNLSNTRQPLPMRSSRRLMRPTPSIWSSRFVMGGSAFCNHWRRGRFLKSVGGVGSQTSDQLRSRGSGRADGVINPCV